MHFVCACFVCDCVCFVFLLLVSVVFVFLRVDFVCVPVCNGLVRF